MLEITIKDLQKAREIVNAIFSAEIELPEKLVPILNEIMGKAAISAHTAITQIYAKDLAPENILHFVCKELQTTPKKIAKNRSEHNAFARHIYLYAASQMIPGKSYTEIAAVVNQKPCSVNYATGKLIRIETANYPFFAEKQRTIFEKLSITSPHKKRNKQTFTLIPF